MSGYLSHIAALSLNLAEIVQPRLSGMFESTETGLDSLPARNELGEMSNLVNDPSVTGNARLNENTDSATPTKSKYRVDKQSENKVQVKLVDECQNSRPKIETAETKAPILEASFTPPKSLVNPSSLMESQLALKTSKVDVATQFENNHKPIIEKIVERTVIERTSSLSPVTEQDQLEPVNREQTLVDSNHSELQSKKSKDEAIDSSKTIVASTQKVVVEPQIQAYTPPKEVQRVETNSYAASVPTIQVTIGRIEIRATQSTDKSISRSRPTSNTMSLDDYLRQRSGGAKA